MTDFIVEFIVFAFQLLFWYTISSIFLNFLLRRVDKEAKDDIEKILDRVNEIVHRVRIEEHYNTYYWYDADSDKFLAQGATPAELIDRLKIRFPEHIFLLEEKDSMLKVSAPNWKMEKLPNVD
jgi:hypothetical protein